MSGFRENLARVNAAAVVTAWFLWRLQRKAGDATEVRVLEEPLVLFNLSVWEPLEELRRFTYRYAHGDFFRRRCAWFRRPERESLALGVCGRRQVPDGCGGPGSIRAFGGERAVGRIVHVQDGFSTHGEKLFSRD